MKNSNHWTTETHKVMVVSAGAAVNLDLDLQIAPELAVNNQYIPDQQAIENWILATLSTANASGDNQLTVRIVDEAEIKTLNETYRHKSGVTNVLSFPFDAPPGVSIPLLEKLFGELLGDIIICAPVVQQEARLQHKQFVHHWAHMIVHGTLHLLGYDHLSEQQAEEMETMEINILAEFGIPNPYTETQAQ
jgi:probable rRNA maturation factor